MRREANEKVRDHSFPCWHQPSILPPRGFLVYRTHPVLTGAPELFQMSQELFRKQPHPGGAKGSSQTLITYDSSQGLSMLSRRNKKGSDILYSLHINQGMSRAMLLASYAVIPCFIVLLRYWFLFFLQTETCDNSYCVGRWWLVFIAMKFFVWWRYVHYL